MGLFDRAGLPRDAYRSLAAAVGGRPSVLAWGSGPDGLVVGLPGRLASLDEGQWSLIGWHQILTGGWTSAEQLLSWRTIDGSQTQRRLDNPGALPELFRERVEATIVVRRRHEFGSGKAALLVARRSLDDATEPLAWTLTPHGRLSAEDTASAQAELDRLRAEYDIG